MRQLIVATACLLVGCAEESDLRLIVEDPSEDGPAVISLDHTAAVHFESREVPGAVLPGGTLVFAAQSADVCSTLQMGGGTLRVRADQPRRAGHGHGLGLGS